MLREIELAALTVNDVTRLDGEGCGTAQTLIGASKTDTEAQGATLQLTCTCPATDCPVAAVKRLCLGKQPYQHLVCTRNGKAVDKETLISTMK